MKTLPNRRADISHPRLLNDKSRSVRCIGPKCIRYARIDDPICWPCQNKLTKPLRAKFSRAKQTKDKEQLSEVVKLIVDFFNERNGLK